MNQNKSSFDYNFTYYDYNTNSDYVMNNSSVSNISNISISDNTTSSPYMYTTVTAPSPYVYTTDSITANWKENDATLHVKGDANFEGDVTIKGKSIIDSLEKIEERLAILHPNIELEKKWKELRNIRKKYVELEKELLEKQKMWSILEK